MRNRRALLYYGGKAVEREAFVVRMTTSGKSINFWHITADHTYFYTFAPNDFYSRGIVWTKDLCRTLANELRCNNSPVDVERFAIDGVLFICTNSNAVVPKCPIQIEEWNEQIAKIREKERIAEIERVYGAQSAPFVVFAKHIEREKEYIWWLTPDVPERQSIVPGDCVIVWTRYGYRTVVVTRIESSDKVNFTPTCRVVCKA